MDITFDCSNCGQNLSIDEASAGLTIQCPSCGQSITVPIPAKAGAVTPKRRPKLRFDVPPPTEQEQASSVGGALKRFDKDLAAERERTLAEKAASEALACAIFGFFCCGVLFFPVSFWWAIRAKQMLKPYPNSAAVTKANAALIIAGAGLFLWSVFFVLRILLSR
jgi:DNA-directed RNA polymerase subunit RPC12/RpoP